MSLEYKHSNVFNAHDFIGRKIITSSGSTIEVVAIDRTIKGMGAALVLECSICSKDKELFPEPFIKTPADFIAGKTGCACTTANKHWTEEQYKIRIKRVFNPALPAKFIKFGDYNQKRTSVYFKCLVNPEHKRQRTTIESIQTRGVVCKDCAKEKFKYIRERNDLKKQFKNKKY